MCVDICNYGYFYLHFYPQLIETSSKQLDETLNETLYMVCKYVYMVIGYLYISMNIYLKDIFVYVYMNMCRYISFIPHQNNPYKTRLCIWYIYGCMFMNIYI
jgi:hypothetical protein